eukprot:scaffold55788_cov69-Phaeocystis_antarctica.AAC.1
MRRADTKPVGSNLSLSPQLVTPALRSSGSREQLHAQRTAAQARKRAERATRRVCVADPDVTRVRPLISSLTQPATGSKGQYEDDSVRCFGQRASLPQP